MLRAYLDSCVVIYLHEGTAEQIERLRHQLRPADDDRPRNKWLRTRRLMFEWAMTLKSGAVASWHIEVDKRKHWGVAREWADADEQKVLDRRMTRIGVYDEQAEQWDREEREALLRFQWVRRAGGIRLEPLLPRIVDADSVHLLGVEALRTSS